jgi:UDP-3-O-[3-hydroxymyristoyl] N-acetylglucosamine deacetylase
VRHKTLDAIGDLALAGLPMIGAYRSYCGGHKMNVAVLEALFSDATCYDIVESPRSLHVARHAQTLRASAAAYAPDVN